MLLSKRKGESGFTPLEKIMPKVRGEQHFIKPMMAKNHQRCIPLEMIKSLTGFTLLEILLAILVLVIGISSLVTIFSTGIFSNQDAENTIIAINLATEKIDELKNTEFADITSEAETPVLGFPTFTRSVSVVTTPPNPTSSLKTVTVNIDWQVKSQAQSHSITTLFADF